MKAQVNEQFNFSFEQTDFDWDCLEVRAGQFHILYKGQSLVADVVAANSSEKTFVIRINNSNYSVQLKDQFDELLHSLGMDNLNSQQHGEIKAPMPGRVLEVVVSVGAAVTKGDGVLVLEAMKMENVIKSPADGVVKSIAVQNGATVEKGEVLLEFE
jgi:biotin carboxyl carrier protein